MLRLVTASGGRVIALGAAIGLGLSVAAGRLLTSMLFGVPPIDLVTLASVGLVLLAAAAVSMAAPAWRAARIDPATALRTE